MRPDRPGNVFEHTSGKLIAQSLDELLDQLTALSGGASLPPLPQPQTGANHLALTGRAQDFTVPLTHLTKYKSKRIACPELKQAADFDHIDLDRRRLLGLAKQIDAKSDSRTRPYYHDVLKKLLNELAQAKDDTPFGECVSISSGPTQLLVAPTGGGKSVLAHVAALELAAPRYPGCPGAARYSGGHGGNV